MADILSTGSQALGAFNKALSIVSNNVANVNTPGYARQEALLSDATPTMSGGHYVGNGTSVIEVKRYAEDYLTQQLNNATSRYEQYANAHNLSSQLDAIVGSASEGISAQLVTYFQSMQNMANDPTSASTRQVVLQQGTNLISQVQAFDQVRSDLYDQTNSEIAAIMDEVDSLSDQFIALNVQMKNSKSLNGAVAPDLLDKRDQLMLDMSKYLDVQIINKEDGTVDIYTAGGSLPLVTDNSKSGFTADWSDYRRGSEVPKNQELFWEHPIGSRQFINVTNKDFGGRLGGVLDFRTSALQQSEDELGLTMVGMAALINAQHRQGYDFLGAPGEDFFSANGQTDPNDFFASFMQSTYVDKNNKGDAVLTVGLDQSGVTASDLSGSNDVAAIEDVVSQLKPTRYQVLFDGTGYNIKDLSNDEIVARSGALAPGSSITFHGLQLDLSSGTPQEGDSFIIDFYSDSLNNYKQSITDQNKIAYRGVDVNTSAARGTGDNTNLQYMSLYSEKRIFYGNSEDIQGSFTAMAVHVGAYVQGAEVSMGANDALKINIQNTRDELSGVNLDEEAANLIRFQQSYQAAAQIISTAQEMFNTLMGLLR